MERCWASSWGLGALGGVIGPTLTGWVFDRMASYDLIWLIFSGLCILSLVPLLFMAPATERKRCGSMKRIFYGWYIVGARLRCCNSSSPRCSCRPSAPTFAALRRRPRLVPKPNSRAPLPCTKVEAAILGPLLGWIIDRFGPQWVIRVGVVICGTGFILLSSSSIRYRFYAAFIVTALGRQPCAASFRSTWQAILWFDSTVDGALSALQIGMVLGGLALPLVAWPIAVWGWRVTAFTSGIHNPSRSACRFPSSSGRRPEDMGEVIRRHQGPSCPFDARPRGGKTAEKPPRDFHRARGAAHRSILAAVTRPRPLRCSWSIARQTRMPSPT